MKHMLTKRCVFACAPRGDSGTNILGKESIEISLQREFLGLQPTSMALLREANRAFHVKR